ncbi:hypothetical protein MRB53_013804 [Persea americana]|uniref:Uncharacterized protein n=1 Tax=Persea americana TaxID=3435 RepID=A0ACC2K906_PERAE|nr:hypothetical protein MRB53_013804 [Persea americana]
MGEKGQFLTSGSQWCGLAWRRKRACLGENERRLRAVAQSMMVERIGAKGESRSVRLMRGSAHEEMVTMERVA